MKILWFTNGPMPDVNNYFREERLGTGGWMGALLAYLKKRDGVQLGVVTACSQYPDTNIEIDGVRYYIINQKGQKYRRSLVPVDDNPKYLRRCVEIVEEFAPDCIHIHGTERFYGEMVCKNLIDSPVIISLQGLMLPYSEWYHWFGKERLVTILKYSLKDSLKGSGLLWELRLAKNAAKREKRVVKKCKYFFGRTEWDKAYVKFYSPTAKYFHANEMMRTPFWHVSWKLEQCKRHRIIFTNTRHPRKGAELLVAAVERLKVDYPDVQLVLIGALGWGGFGRWMKKKIAQLGDSVVALGPQNSSQIAKQLIRSHVFVSASYMDNSPNSVAEAQLVGMPVVSTFTGGTPTMIEDGQTGLMFPTGDVPLLVEKIKSIFENDDLAIQLGEKAKCMAQKRHDPELIVGANIAAYKCMISARKDHLHADIR